MGTTHRLVHGLALGLALALALAMSATAQSTVHLPLVAADNPTCRLPGPDGAYASGPQPEEAAPDLRTAATRILPLGNQLDDVGQYYSQVAPSLSSTAHIANSAVASQTFTLTLYGDTGNMVRSLQACRIAAGDTWTLQASGGLLHLYEDYREIEPQTVCAVVKEGKDAQGHPAALLHGLYHAEISADEQGALDVHVDTRPDPAYSQAEFPGASRVRAVASDQAANAIRLPGILATRDRHNWWDTEVIVQNVSDIAVDVKFQICDDTGRCFDNNAARLRPHERRVFLASHLLYEDTPDGLVERAGWVSGTVRATPVQANDAAAKIAVLVNYFRQEVRTEELHPKAERGSQCLFSAPPVRPARAFDFPVAGAKPFHLRIFNPAGTSNRVSLSLLDSTGALLGSRSTEMTPRGTWSLSEDDLWSDLAGDSMRVDGASALALRIQAESAVSVLPWDNGGLRQPQGQTGGSAAWYAPLLAAPAVPFRWDEAREPERAQQPGAQFGLAETRPQDHQLRPAWARAMNWYDARYRAVGFEERWCLEAVGADSLYSTYIPMWRGLGQCNDASPDDRTCVNTDARLQRVRNSLPSSCAGRPLFLANEPDLSGQTYMTFHELGRLIYVLRDWPGELFSPVFASYSYDRPIYPPERTDWCRQALAQSLCPQTPGCEICRQDGVLDGKSDPFDISFKGLEEYFAEPHRWARDQVWRFEDFIEGMLIHFYPEGTDVLDDRHWRVPYLQQYRDRATEAGWPLIVKEYGFAIWPDESGIAPDMSRTDIADLLDNSRRFLLQNLGNGEQEHGGNPFKIFWYQTGCDSPNSVWGKLCLFQTPQTLLDPVGTCWVDDAARNDTTERQCGQTGPVQ